MCRNLKGKFFKATNKILDTGSLLVYNTSIIFIVYCALARHIIRGNQDERKKHHESL